MTDPTYFEPNRNDLPSSIGGINPDLLPVAATRLESLSSRASSERQHLIFRVLTQVLSPLGVRFKFVIQRHPQTPSVKIDREQTVLQSPDLYLQTLEHRLWVQCDAQTSLDSQLLAKPLASALREIGLESFQDAIVQFSRFAGRESVITPAPVADWRLKIDLTPPTIKLRSWARWGDVQSITKLLNLALAPAQIQVSALLKNFTLQIFCTLKQPQTAKFPAKKIVLDTIAPLLIALTPQGIQCATIHGIESQLDNGAPSDDSYVWMHWLDLPALGDPKFSPTPIILAAQGDRDALNFILERLLNPDLEQCFELGGIGISLLRRYHLLHIMSEAPVCPIQSQVATTVIKVMRQLRLPGISSVRIHGRISGQSVSVWTYGVDFDTPQAKLPPPDPVTSASGASQQRVIVEPSAPEMSMRQRIYDYLVATGIWKPQLSMVKTNQLSYQPRFQWQPPLLFLVVGLGLAIGTDLAVKFALQSRNLTASSPAIGSQLSFNNPLLEQKLAQYQLRCLQHGVPDILIVGSSRAMRGVDPEVLRRGAIERGYPNLKIYNFGINGATAQIVDLILRQLLTPQQLPKLVIWADGARAFNSGRSDRTYETIALSKRYRQLGLMPGVKNNSPSLFQAQSSFQNTYQAIDTAIDRQLDTVSLAYHHRDRLKTWLQTRMPGARQLNDSRSSLLSVDASGETLPHRKETDFDGFLSLEVQFDPATYYQKFHKVTGESDGDYANFQLLGSQDRALHQTLDLLATHQIPLVFVNVPLTDIYLDKFRTKHETVFKQYMQKLMASRQLTFVDMVGLIDRRYDRFSDPSHLNQLGAIDVSRYLARSQEIPWQVLAAPNLKNQH